MTVIAVFFPQKKNIRTIGSLNWIFRTFLFFIVLKKLLSLFHNEAIYNILYIHAYLFKQGSFYFFNLYFNLETLYPFLKIFWDVLIRLLALWEI